MAVGLSCALFREVKTEPNTGTSNETAVTMPSALDEQGGISVCLASLLLIFTHNILAPLFFLSSKFVSLISAFACLNVTVP